MNKTQTTKIFYSFGFTLLMIIILSKKCDDIYCLPCTTGPIHSLNVKNRVVVSGAIEDHKILVYSCIFVSLRLEKH